MDESLVVGDVWTDEKVEEVLRADLARFEKAINDHVHVELTQNQYDALVSWLFNVGEQWATNAELVYRLNSGDYAGAAEGFDHFHVPPEITSRRNGEKAQFMGTAYVARID
jgi:lysozyme